MRSQRPPTKYLNSWDRGLLEQPIVTQLAKNFLSFYGTESLLPCSRESKARLCMTFRNKLFSLRWGVVSPSSNPQPGGPPFFRCSQMLIQYICGYCPYLGAVYSIYNLRTLRGEVTETHVTCIQGQPFKHSLGWASSIGSPDPLNFWQRLLFTL
jgi:hypothetical protein